MPLITLLRQLRIHWRLSRVLKTSNKSVWSNVFWYVNVYIFWKFIQYNIHWDKTQMLKKFPSNKINAKKCTIFSFASPNSSVLLLICNSYTSWSTRFISLKLCLGFSIFNSVSSLLKFIFLINKKHALFDFKTP